jgi:hypothetical protein
MTFQTAVVPVKAGAQLWSAFMFNQTNGQLMLLTNVMNGAPQTYALPKPSGYDEYAWRAAVSHDWHYITYTVSNKTSGRKAIIIYNRETNAALHTIALEPSHVSVDFHASELIYNETSTSIALGYSTNNENGWELKAIQIGTSAPEIVLRHDSPAARALNIGAQFMLPVVRRFVGSDVTFVIVRTGTEGESEYQNYTWNISNGTVRVEPVAQFPTFSTDIYLPTGETISELVDGRLPSCNDCSPYYISNTLAVYDPIKKTRYPFFNTTELALFLPTFIQNGERILFGGNVSINSNGLPKMAVVERSGKLVGYLTGVSASTNPVGWQDGFMYVSPGANPNDPPRLTLVNTRSGLGNSQVVWTGTPGTQVSLLQTPSNMQFAGPFQPWGQLAAPGVAPTMTMPAASGGVLAVGKTAVVNTTEGDKLRVRSGPGTSFGVLTMLAKGTVVTLLEGPRNADGLTWWRVRPPDGIEGWVIEGVTDKGVYIQTLIPQ